MSSTEVDSSQTTCGCGGVAPATPIAIDNRPGLSAIQYRVGTYATFYSSMVAALSRSDLPQLGGLTTRDPSDFSLALIDAWATTADVLTFYQERIANEAYLRTAVERTSVGFLAGLIGYQPRPGVAASTVMAFQLDTSTGAPPKTSIPVGTQVQSVPASGQTAQTFETIETIEARPVWNAMTASLTQPPVPAPNATTVYVQGISPNLKPGDALLFTDGTSPSATSPLVWDFVRVLSLTPDSANNRTLVAFDTPLGQAAPHNGSYTPSVEVFALRQRASLWGYNAPDYHSIASALQNPSTLAPWDLDSTLSPQTTSVVLDTTYPQATKGDWVIFTQISPPALVSSPPPSSHAVDTELFGISSLSEAAFAAYLLTGKATVLNLVGPGLANIAKFTTRGASVYLQTDQLTLSGDPYVDPNTNQPSSGLPLASPSGPVIASPATSELASPPVGPVLVVPAAPGAPFPQPGTPSPVEGSEITLVPAVAGLCAGQTIAVTGKRIHVQILSAGVTAGLSLTTAGAPVTLRLNQILEVMAAPVQQSGTVTLSLRTLDGVSGTLVVSLPERIYHYEEARLANQIIVGYPIWYPIGYVAGPYNQFVLVPAPKTAEVVTEVATLSNAATTTDPLSGQSSTLLQLVTPALGSSYDRTTVTICANIAAATHGATVSEVLGNGAASQPFQTFTLKQAPLTFVPASNAAGAASTLVVTVTDVTWQGVSQLYGQTSSARVYVTEIADDATSTIEFGDGGAGARLPTGVQNVRATYRVGLGTAGNLPAGALTLLTARPLGVRGVSNPIAATGGADPELLASARANAGLTILTLDRVVSLLDYQNFAQAFAGVGKASADWVWDGRQRSVLLTLAAADGSTVSPTGTLATTLVTALQDAGDPNVSIMVVSYRPVTFELGLLVVVAPDYVNSSADVLAAVEAALRARFSFAQQAFAQLVVLSQVVTVAQQVTGVLAVNITSLYRSDAAPSASSANLAINPSLPAATAQPPQQQGAQVAGAELLTLDPGPLAQLQVMS